MVAAAPPPPASIAPYVHGETFDPGDYLWLRGRFPGAGPDEKRSDASLLKWLEQCAGDGGARVRAELAEMGARDPQLSLQPYPGTLCESVASADLDTRPWKSFADFSADLAVARPLADTLLWATDLAVERGGPRGPTLADALVARPLGEQMLRTAADWGDGGAAGAPELPPKVRRIVVSRISAAIMRADRANTAYLKAIVARQGWPDRKEVGDHAAHQAWLLAQHADADPAFQLKVLRLMEPMVASGAVHPSDFAYLYDRIMLKLAGRQRYGTQVGACRAGRRVLRPLESEADLSRRRKEAGLEPIADYMKQLDAAFGRCPAAPAEAPTALPSR